MVLRTVGAKTIRLSVVSNKTRALVVIDPETLGYRIIDCSRRNFCKIYVSKECPPYCPVIVATKDFVTGRRKPKAEIMVLD